MGLILSSENIYSSGYPCENEKASHRWEKIFTKYLYLKNAYI